MAPDDLEPLLGPTPSTPDPAARDGVFRRTTAALARGRRLRQLRSALVLLAVFAIGGAVGWAVKPTPAPLRPEPEVVIQPVPVPVPPPAPAESPGQLAADPARLELAAEQADTPAESARLYRAAGDSYLADRSDIRSALRCYRLYLAEAGPDGRRVRADDSWLLMNLKTSHTHGETP